MKHSYSWNAPVPDWHPEKVHLTIGFREALILMTLNREMDSWRALSAPKKIKALSESPDA